MHKFSKFIHGCAILLPEEVRAAPYWIDDSSLKDSIVASGALDLIEGPSHGANEYYQHLLPHDEKGNIKKAAVGGGSSRRESAESDILRGGKGSRQSIGGVGGAELEVHPKGGCCRETIDMFSASRDEVAADAWDGGDFSGRCCEWAAPIQVAHMTIQKV